MIGAAASRYPGLMEQMAARSAQAKEAKRAANATGPLPLAQVIKLVREIEGLLPGLPPDTQKQVRPTLAEAKREMDKDSPNTTRIAGQLMAIRAVCAQAGGDIPAAKVVEKITKLFVDNAA